MTPNERLEWIDKRIEALHKFTGVELTKETEELTRNALENFDVVDLIIKFKESQKEMGKVVLNCGKEPRDIVQGKGTEGSKEA